MATGSQEEEGVVQKLFKFGNFGHILIKIFQYLPGPSLDACVLVNREWHQFIMEEILQKHPIGWKDVLPTSSQFQLPRGRTLAMKASLTEVLVGYEDGCIELRDRLNLSKLILPPMPGHSNLIRSVNFGRNFIVSGSWDECVKIWDKTSGKCLMTSVHHTGPVTSVILNCDETELYSSARDGMVKKLTISKDHTDHFEVKLDPDFCLHHDDCVIDMILEDDKILTGCSDAKLILWSIKTQSILQIFIGHKNGIRSVFMRNGVIASGGKDHYLKIWNVSQGKCINTFEHANDVRSVCFNSEICLASDESSDVYIWNLKAILEDQKSDNTQVLLNVVTGHNGFVHSIHFTPTCILTCDVTGLIYERDAFTCLKEKRGLRILKCSDGVNCMTCDKEYVICGLLDKSINVFNRQDKSLVRRLTGHIDHIWSLDQDSRIVVSGSWDATVMIWSKKTWGFLFKFVHPDSREISAVKIRKGTVFVGCLSGSLAILTESNHGAFQLKQLIQTPTQGGVYSLDIQSNKLLTSHAKHVPTLQEWHINEDNVFVNPSRQLNEKSHSESIIWSLHLSYPLALLCHDNEMMDIYHLESDSCLRTLRHSAKVLDAKLKDGIIIVGCQYGHLAFWNLNAVLESPKTVLDVEKDSMLCLNNQHSAAIGGVHVDDEEVITNDYDGIVVLRNIRKSSLISSVFPKLP